MTANQREFLSRAMQFREEVAKKQADKTGPENDKNSDIAEQVEKKYGPN